LDLFAARSKTPRADAIADIEPKVRHGFGRQGVNYSLDGDNASRFNEPEAIIISFYLKGGA
jgi:hypothetical protein